MSDRRQNRKTPDEQRKANALIINENIEAYIAICKEVGLNGDEMLILENGIAIEKAIRICCDGKYQEKREKKAREAQRADSNFNADSIGIRLVKRAGSGTNITYHAVVELTSRSRIVQILKSHWGNELNRAKIAGKRLGFSALFASNLEAIIYQRGRNTARRNGSAELFTLTQGAGIETRYKWIMEKHIGIGVLIADAKGLINGKREGKKGVDANVKLRAGTTGSPLERAMQGIEKKAFPGPLRALARRVVKANYNDAREALNVIAEASLLLKPQITNKMTMPWCMWLAARLTLKDEFANFCAYAGRRAFEVFNIAMEKIGICSFQGTIMNDDEIESIEDKAQVLMMACFGLAYEDFSLVSAMVSHPLKLRNRMKIGNFRVGEKVSTVLSPLLRFTRWAEFAQRFALQANTSREGAQISNSAVFAVERKITTDVQRVEELLNKVQAHEDEPLQTLYKKVREQISIIGRNKSEIKEFLGSSMYDLNDQEKQNPINFRSGAHPFFFEFDPDYNPIRVKRPKKPIAKRNSNISRLEEEGMDENSEIGQAKKMKPLDQLASTSSNIPGEN
uniref:Nucleoprotein n=4 Tax=Influenza C virus TaxID=11552 RepID=A0A193PQM9_9ORTO|nr:nucleoprotein [Influenza C virus (C/Yamagata/7/81)]BAV18701.1 nucleoprotein [Influenza C virus (C/Yamagata/10/1981)]BAV18702.1 nucleoprotein [Influenza C virus (C/Yamagata/26/81)]